MLNQIITSPYVTLFSILLAIVGFIYAIYCDHKNKKRKEFSYSKQHYWLFDKSLNQVKGLSVLYNEQKINSLCVSEYKIWNSGNRKLESSDMATYKELTIIALNGSQILNAEITKFSEESNQFALEIVDSSTIKISFDYVDTDDGITLQILHTGSSNCLKLSGKIKDGKPLNNVIYSNEMDFLTSTTKSRFVITLFTIFLIILMLVSFSIFIVSTISIFNLDLQSMLFTEIDTNTMTAYPSQSTAIFFSVFSFIVTIITSFFNAIFLKNLLKYKIPKKLK